MARRNRVAASARLIALLSGLTMAHAALAQATDKTSAIAWIAVESSRSGAVLTGRATALTDAAFDALMSIEKKGPSGSMSTKQGGSFALKAGESADVATVGLSMSPGDRLVIELTLTSDGHEIASSMVSVND